MVSVVERLRASKRDFEQREFQGGLDAGKGWVDDAAEYDQLLRLVNLHEQGEGNWDSLFDGTYAMVGSEFFRRLNPSGDGDDDAHAPESFWEDVVGECAEPTSVFVKGFAEGALARWHELVGEVEEQG
jgi:hypothetical protein